jgi:DNA topoisomerase I
MDKAIPSTGHVQPGISIRNGPMEEHDHPMPDVNGVKINGSTSKRKSRGSLSKPYKDADTSDEDNEPLVRYSFF